MEKVYRSIYMGGLVALLLLLAGGCKKAPINGKIEGMWKLEEFTTHEDGVTHPCERIYYSMQLWVVDVAEKQGPNGYKASVGRLVYGEDEQTVVMKDFHYRDWTTDSKEPTALEDLKPYGLNSLETEFKVVKANGKHLILQSDYATLRLTSF